MYRFYFVGRKSGAIGITYSIMVPFVADTTEEAACLATLAGWETFYVKSYHEVSP